jgi:large subunit ribosomal protein L13
MKHITLDASGKKLGRLASEIASLLRGKQNPFHVDNKVAEISILVEHINALDISAKKMKEESYQRYSGYPGGLKTETREHFVGRFGLSAVLMKAVRGMLPNNRLRNDLLKKITITE